MRQGKVRRPAKQCDPVSISVNKVLLQVNPEHAERAK